MKETNSAAGGEETIYRRAYGRWTIAWIPVASRARIHSYGLRAATPAYEDVEWFRVQATRQSGGAVEAYWKLVHRSGYEIMVLGLYIRSDEMRF